MADSAGAAISEARRARQGARPIAVYLFDPRARGAGAGLRFFGLAAPAQQRGAGARRRDADHRQCPLDRPGGRSRNHRQYHHAAGARHHARTARRGPGRVSTRGCRTRWPAPGRTSMCIDERSQRRSSARACRSTSSRAFPCPTSRPAAGRCDAGRADRPMPCSASWSQRWVVNILLPMFPTGSRR